MPAGNNYFQCIKAFFTSIASAELFAKGIEVKDLRPLTAILSFHLPMQKQVMDPSNGYSFDSKKSKKFHSNSSLATLHIWQV